MENLLPHVIKRISQEIRQLVLNPVEGISLVTNEREITDIRAIIDGPADTPYENGKFNIRIVLSNSYPHKAPSGYFITKIFHPNISPKNGEVCVNILKKDWNEDIGIKKILLTIKCLLIYPNADSALNEEAGQLLLEDYTEYAKRAKLYTSIYAIHTSSHSQNSSNNYVSNQPQLTSSSSSSTQPSTSVLKTNSESNEAGPVAKKINSNEIPPSNDSAQKRTIQQHKKALRRL